MKFEKVRSNDTQKDEDIWQTVYDRSGKAKSMRDVYIGLEIANADILGTPGILRFLIRRTTSNFIIARVSSPSWELKYRARGASPTKLCTARDR